MSGLPAGWLLATIEGVTSPIESIDPYNTPQRQFRYVDIGSIDNKTQSIREAKAFLGCDAPSRARRVIRTSDTLFSTVRTYLKNVALVPPSLDGELTSTGIAVLRPNEAVDPRYLYRWACSNSFIEPLSEAQDGTMYPAVSDRDVAAAPIPLPPLPEQRRIVAKIDSLTAKSRRARDHLDHIPRLVEKYKQAVLAAAFRGDLTREWRREQQGLEAVSPRNEGKIKKKYHDSGNFLPPYILPTNWSWLRLPQLGDMDRGKSRHRPRNDKRLFGGPYPFIQTGEVRSADRFVTTYSSTYSEFGLEQSRLWPAGTVCITIAANIAETAILGMDACFPDSVVGFLADGDRIDAAYTEFFVRTARQEIQAFAPSTAQKNINLDTLSAIRIPVAPLIEQGEIVRRVDGALTWIDRLAAEASSARALVDRLDQAVLAKAFRGELVPQDPADGPASMLLDRIREERAAAPKPKRGRRPRAAA